MDEEMKRQRNDETKDQKGVTRAGTDKRMATPLKTYAPSCGYGLNENGLLQHRLTRMRTVVDPADDQGHNCLLAWYSLDLLNHAVWLHLISDSRDTAPPPGSVGSTILGSENIVSDPLCRMPVRLSNIGALKTYEDINPGA